MARKPSDSPQLFEQSFRPDFSFEQRQWSKGHLTVAGTDEAGRGPIAGPVVAAAVILDENNVPAGLDDSKRMSFAARETVFLEILARSQAVSFACISAEEIDRTDIRKASLEAMRKAVIALSLQTDHVLIDGRDVPSGLPVPGTAIIKGDQLSLSIAAASIVAKVMRDRMMTLVAQTHTIYGFDKHFGYGTKKHMETLAEFGPVTRLHRFSFAPIRKD